MTRLEAKPRYEVLIARERPHHPRSFVIRHLRDATEVFRLTRGQIVELEHSGERHEYRVHGFGVCDGECRVELWPMHYGGANQADALVASAPTVVTLCAEDATHKFWLERNAFDYGLCLWPVDDHVVSQAAGEGRR